MSRRFAPILLSTFVVLLLISIARLDPFGGTPAFAAFSSGAGGSSGSSGSSGASSTASSQPTPPPGTPPDSKGGTGGGDTTFNLARDARDQPLTLVVCRADRKTPDLYFRNSGNTTLEAGTVIHWQVPKTHEHGDYMLPRDVKPGDYLPDTGVLAATLGPDGICRAKLT